MPLNTILNSMSFQNAEPSSFRLTEFRGLNKSAIERMLYQSATGGGFCYTPKGSNFVIDRGMLTPRNNYAEVLPSSQTVTAAMNDGYTYKIKSMHVYANKGDTTATATLLLGVEAYSGGTLHHCCLLHRPLTFGTGWAEVQTGLLSIYGSAKTLYFRSADFKFKNFTGNYLLSTSDDSAAIICNGVDAPVAYVGAGGGALYEQRFAGWVDATIDYTTDTITCASLATNDNAVEFFSRTNALPGGVTGQPASTTTYYVVQASGSTFKVSATLSGSAIDLTSNGANVMMRLISNRATDCPKGEGVEIHKDRVWMYIGNTVYFSDKVYPDTTDATPYAHCRDWSTTLKADNVPILTFDGDAIQTVIAYDGNLLAIKENSVHRITNSDYPFAVEQLFSTKGTIAPKSACVYMRNLIYATTEGLNVYNGSSSSTYLGEELDGIWYPDTSCIGNVVGDLLMLYGYMYDALTGSLAYRILAVDLPTKNVFQWDMVTALAASPLAVVATMDAFSTTLKSGVVRPEFWFAYNDMVYKYGGTAPAAGAAQTMTYYLPENDFGTAMHTKQFSRLAAIGSGGALVVTPTADNTAKTAKTITLPTTNGATRPTQFSTSGKMLKFALTNSGGSVPILQSFDAEYTVGG